MFLAIKELSFDESTSSLSQKQHADIIQGQNVKNQVRGQAHMKCTL